MFAHKNQNKVASKGLVSLYSSLKYLVFYLLSVEPLHNIFGGVFFFFVAICLS